MLEQTIGESTFDDAIRKFVNRHAYRSASVADFARCIDE